MNNLKRVNKILAFTLLIFSIFALASYSKSASKYYQDKESIVFDTNLVSLYHNTGGDTVNFSILKDSSDRTKITYRYKFIRNKDAFFEDEINNNLGEEYTVSIDSNCVISSVTSGKTNFKLPDNIKNKYTLTFKDAPKDNEEINVEYYCPVDLSNDDPIETNVKVYEKINGDNSDFLYLFYSSKITKDEYRKLINDNGIVMDYDTITIPDYTSTSDIKKSIRTWLREYIKEYKSKNKDNKDLSSIIVDNGPLSAHDETYDNPLEKYIYEKFGDFSDLSLDLLGLTITHENDNYVFKLDDKFVGYALTDWHYSDSSKMFYFSSSIKNETEITEIFNYYVEKYMSDDKDAVYEYFTKIGGIYKFLNGEVKVNPMIMMYSGGRLIFLPNFLKDSSIVTWDPDKENDNNSRRTRIFTTIYSQMMDLWPDEYHSQTEDPDQYAYINRLVANTMFGYNVSNVKRETPIFNDYLVLHTETRDILINVYNSNVDGNIITYAKVDELIDSFTYDSATTISYVTSTIGSDNAQKTNALLVDEVKKYSKKLDVLNSTNYTDSITEELVSKNDFSKGIHRLDNTGSNTHFLLVTFVNTIDDYNQYVISHVPDANVSTASNEILNGQSGSNASETTTSTTKDSGTTTATTSESQTTTQSTTTTTIAGGKNGNDEGENNQNPEPDITGDGGEE